MSAVGTHLRRAPLGAILCACLALASAGRAQPATYAVNPEIVYLPQYGVALDAATGHVAWRVARFDGPIFTDGRGLLVVGYLASVNAKLHFRQMRFCRLDTNNGHFLWCFTTPAVYDAVLGATGAYLYLHQNDRLQIYTVANGRRLKTLHLRDREADGELLPLADGGIAVFSRTPRASRLLTYHPPAPRPKRRFFAWPLFAFHGPGAGVLWYAPLADRFDAVLGAAPPDSEAPAASSSAAPLDSMAPFPRAVTDEDGYVVERWEHGRHVLSGGSYNGSAWALPASGQPRVFLQGDWAGILQRQPSPSGRAAPPETETRLLHLATGATQFSRLIPDRLTSLSFCPGASGADRVALFGPKQILLLATADGHALWWRDYRAQEPASCMRPAVLTWDQGELLGLAAANGDVIWRVRFSLGRVGPSPSH